MTTRLIKWNSTFVKVSLFIEGTTEKVSRSEELFWGAQKLMEENLKLVWAEFSTISMAVLKICMKLVCGRTPTTIVENSAQVLSC